MTSINPISDHLQGRKTPKFVISYFINEDHSHKHPILPHIHADMLELYFIEKGTNHYMVNGKFYDLKAGDIVICNQDTLHGEFISDPRSVRSFSIGITDVMLRGLPANHLIPEDEVPVISTGALCPQIAELFRLIHVLSADPVHLQETCNSLAASVLLYTYELIQSGKRHKVMKKSSSTELISRRIRSYLDLHYSESPNLDQISDALKINKYYIAHIFKNDFGTSPVQYMLNRRVGESELLLMNTDISVSLLADKLGFNSISHFSTTFSKNVGLSPEQFRKAFHNMECVVA